MLPASRSNPDLVARRNLPSPSPPEGGEGVHGSGRARRKEERVSVSAGRAGQA